MSREHARISTSLKIRDPRLRRGQSPAFNEPIQLGEGLEADRQGRVRVRFDPENEQDGKFLRSDYQWENPQILSVRTVTAADTAFLNDQVVLGDATGGAFSLTLQPAMKAKGRLLRVKKIDASGNAVTLDGDGSETIDGSATLALAAQYDSVTIYSDGTEWWVLD